MADAAHKKAYARIKKRGNIRVLDTHEPLRIYVVEQMKLGWSPEQVSIRLPIEYPHDETMRVSYETIYAYVYAQIHRDGNGKVKRGRADLRPYLVRRHTRRAKKGFRKAQKVERNASRPSIDARPSVVHERTRIGDFEDDFVVSQQSTARIKSVNDRMSGIHFFGKTKDGTAKAGDAVLKEKRLRIPPQYRKTLTRDNGSENSNWHDVEDALGVEVFYAHPHCSWQRGSNENGNGLFRRFCPKGTNFDIVSDEDIAHAEYLINTRPRERLGGYTPAEVFYQETGVALFP